MIGAVKVREKLMRERTAGLGSTVVDFGHKGRYLLWQEIGQVPLTEIMLCIFRPVGHIHPSLCQILARFRQCFVKNRVKRRHPSAVEPRVKIDFRNYTLLSVVFEIFREKLPPLGSSCSLVAELLAVCLQVFFHFFYPPDEPLQEKQEIAALFVGYTGKGVVWVDTVQLRNEFRKFVVFPVKFDSQFQLLPSSHCVHMTEPLAKLPPENKALRVLGKPLIQPKMLPRGIGHQIARPGMCNLVGHKARLRPIPRQESGRDESEHGVFHAAIGEGGGQNDQVVTAPHIWPAHLLGNADVLFGLFELPCGGFKGFGFRPHQGPGSDLFGNQMASCQGNQVRWNGNLLPKMVGGPPVFKGFR
eukprot:comp6836_c0_seq1/m.2587 comp6836_c0_seq1/g.2587  ORF comp6836_c0_seq1/g.2587 comp6836_c0_seq1/m.2587 type:complete len:358 (+) comp6836_c0_seq1:721-1794(+)